MKNFSAVVSATAIAAGIGGGAIAYQAVAGEQGPAVVAKTTDKVPPAQVTRPGVRFRFAPCKSPAVRIGEACVVDVVQTVVLPTPAAPAAPGESSSQSGDDGLDHEGPATHEGDDAAEPAEAGDDEAREDDDHPGDEEHGEDSEDEPNDD